MATRGGMGTAGEGISQRIRLKRGFTPHPDQRRDWRLHARYETAVGRFTDLVITEARTAEALCCVAVRPGDVVVHDRGYARVRNFVHARAQGADFLTRIGWCSVRLFDLAGQSFDLLAALPDGGEPVAEHQVRIGHARDGIAARLIIARKPPEAIERQHARLRRRASRNGQKTDPRTLRTAGFMMLLTSLPGERANAAEVVEAPPLDSAKRRALEPITLVWDCKGSAFAGVQGQRPWRVSGQSPEFFCSIRSRRRRLEPAASRWYPADLPFVR